MYICVYIVCVSIQLLNLSRQTSRQPASLAVSPASPVSPGSQANPTIPTTSAPQSTQDRMQ